jgi:hypothetical protein
MIDGMSDFEYEDFSLDSLDSIFEDTSIPTTKNMATSNAPQSSSFNSIEHTTLPTSSPGSSFYTNAAEGFKHDFCMNSVPSTNPFQYKSECESRYCHPYFHQNGLNSGPTMNPSNHQYNISSNPTGQSTAFFHEGTGNFGSCNILELQPPPFPSDTLQSPVTDMPGFEWCASLDWSEHPPQDSPITPSSPYGSYPNSNHQMSQMGSNHTSSNPMGVLGPMPPLEMINPSPNYDENFLYSNFSHEMTARSTTTTTGSSSDLNVLGVDLDNLMEENSSSSEMNAKLLTNLTKSAMELTDNHFTPPPSPIDSKHLRGNDSKTSSNPQHAKHHRKRIVISKYQSSTTRKNKKVIPREIKANHMDCHDYTNKVQSNTKLKMLTLLKRRTLVHCGIRPMTSGIHKSRKRIRDRVCTS